jgi:hypothetical protein
MQSLYELTSDWLHVYDMIDEAEEADEDMIIDTLEAIGGEIEIKAEGYAKLIKNLAAEAEALKAEEARLYARRRVKENTIARMKQSLQLAMEAIDKPKIKTELFSFNIQANPESVVIDTMDMENIPEEYRKVTIEPDKTAIKKALKDGAEFPFAHLSQSKSLRIR